MAIKRYIIREPEQLLALSRLRRQDDNASMVNLARVWRARRAAAMLNGTSLPPSYAAVRFDGSARKATVVKTITRLEQSIGLLPYNKALAYCRENLDKVEER